MEERKIENNLIALEKVKNSKYLTEQFNKRYNVSFDTLEYAINENIIADELMAFIHHITT